MAVPRIIEESIGVLSEYGEIPISFEVHSIVEVRPADRPLQRFTLEERGVGQPWTKDYDSHKGEGPRRWASRWDISNWGIISAFLDDTRVGGCAIAYDTAGLDMLEGRKDLAVLWDIRVRPEFRGQRIGSALVDSAVAWARRRGCRQVKVETQNVNVPACRFYAAQGFRLATVSRSAYEDLPDEVQLIWYKQL